MSYQDLLARVRGMDVEAPFNQAAGEMARSRAMDLEALNRQQIEQEQAERAQAVDRGMEILGGNRAAQKRFQQAVERGSQQYNQSVAQMAPQRLAAQMQQFDRESQIVSRQEGEKFQLAVLARREQLQRDLANARNRMQADIARASARRDIARIELARRQSAEQIEASRFRRLGPGGGGGGMGVSFSTGADTFARHLQNMGVMPRNV